MGIWRADHRLAVDARGPALLIRVRNVAAMILAAASGASGASGATDAIGYLALGQVFTCAMTCNLVLLGIAVAHHDGERIGRVLLSLLCFIVGAGLGARIARSPEPDDPVWPSAGTRALAVETVIFVWLWGLLVDQGPRPWRCRQSAARRRCDRRGHSEHCDATVWIGPQHHVSFRVADHLGRLAGDRAPAARYPATICWCWWAWSAAPYSRHCWCCTHRCSHRQCNWPQSPPRSAPPLGKLARGARQRKRGVLSRQIEYFVAVAKTDRHRMFSDTPWTRPSV
jgi:4-amino-4-deoxy-L-arabinose transferase-like glycosyltransferase